MLEQTCALYKTCRFDGWAVWRTIFKPRHVGLVDSFHPSFAGQKLLARVTYAASFDWQKP